MAKQYYFDDLVWKNIVGFVDIKPFKQDVFVNGTYSRKVPFSQTLVQVVEVIGRTKCFVKCITSQKTETKKKIFIENGVEYIKIGNLKITAHENEQYRFATKKEWECYRNPCGSAPPSDDESDESDEESWMAR